MYLREYRIECSNLGKGHKYNMHIRTARNFARRKMFFFCVKDCITDMTTFTALPKLLSLKNYYNTHKNFQLWYYCRVLESTLTSLCKTSGALDMFYLKHNTVMTENPQGLLDEESLSDLCLFDVL